MREIEVVKIIDKGNFEIVDFGLPKCRRYKFGKWTSVGGDRPISDQYALKLENAYQKFKD